MDKKKTVPLSLQIQATEVRIRIRKRLIGYRTAHISRWARRKMTSPPVLLAAVGVGFLLERLLRRVLSRNETAAPKPETKARIGLIARIAEILALGRSLMSSWPIGLLQRFGGGNAAPQTPVEEHSSSVAGRSPLIDARHMPPSSMYH